MKKKHQYLSSFIALVAIITLLVSCSKDQVFISRIPASTTQGSVDNRLGPVSGGSLMLLVLPQDANPIVTIVNENFISKDFYLTMDGYLRIDNIPAGIYKVSIHPQNPKVLYVDSPVTPGDPGYPDMVTGDVKIANGFVTNLGVIKLTW